MKTVVAVFLAISVSASSSRAEVYSDSIAGFSYNVPDDWVLKPVSGGKFKVAFGKVSEGEPANVDIILTKCDHSLRSCLTEDLKDMAKAYEKSGYTDFRVIDTTPFETAQPQHGIKGTIEAKRPDGKRLRQSLYFFEREDGSKFVVSCSAIDVGNKYDAIFDKILRSFRITQ